MIGIGRIVGNLGGRLGLVLAVAGMSLTLSACASVYRNHGYVPSDDQLSLLEVGRDTRETVGDFVGRPASSGVLAEGGWYYVGSRWRESGWRKPEEISREVVAITFAEDGTVANIERFGLERGQVVPLSRRVTDSNIRGVTFLGQLLSSVGNVRADDFIQ